jgi:hypothetical protein
MNLPGDPGGGNVGTRDEGFRHEAPLYAGAEQFVTATADFKGTTVRAYMAARPD